jgi:hypothetical protein
MNASPVRYAGRLAQADFDALYARFDRRDARLTPAMLLLLTFCKMNAGEAYGLRVVTEVHARRERGRADLRSKVIEFAQHEEEYHTRILVGAAGYFDLRATGEYHPSFALRTLIHAIAYAPSAFFHPILLAAEMAGVYTFNWTLNQVGAFIKDQPELRQALEERMIEILIDEIGHVGFNRVVLGNTGRRLGYSLSGLVVRGMTTITAELAALGFTHAVEGAFRKFDYLQLPEEVRRRGFFA